ncbi:MAG: VOC family protein [Pigmentiphaga sp.]
MSIFSLGYVIMEADNPEAWADYAQNVLGAMVVEESKTQAWRVRLDERSFRLRIEPGTDGRLVTLGWQLRNASDFRLFLEQLRAKKVDIQVCSADEAKARDVLELARMTDPRGNVLEFFHGSALPVEPFISPVGVSSLRLGHVVLRCQALAECETFYVEMLGFGVSDYIDFEARGKPLSLVFLHAADKRHHSLALAGAPDGLDHIMIEVENIDEVGHCRERASVFQIPIRADLGRHSNDLTFSYYGISPNGIAVEYGCEGISVDPASWDVKRLSTPSLWGHGPL